MNTVLRRLPVKPLLSRFRCSVSKPFCSLNGDTPSLVTKGEKFLVRSHKISEGFFYVHEFSTNVFLACPIGADEQLETNLLGSRYVGSCKGLVCLWKPYAKGKDDIFLWNPATVKMKKLPIADIPIPKNVKGSSVVGFGYDHVSDDLKVMRTARRAAGIMVSVYSLKNNSWTRADSLSTRLWGRFGVFANGSLYWLGRDNNIVAFDLGLHRQRELSFPDGVDKTSRNGKRLIGFNGCLGLIDHWPGSRTDIWLMNNSVENSWTKLLSLKQPGLLGSFKNVRPITFSNTQNEILIELDSRKLLWYDRESNKVKNVELPGFSGDEYSEDFSADEYSEDSDPFDLIVYNESPVSYDSELYTRRSFRGT